MPAMTCTLEKIDQCQPAKESRNRNSADITFGAIFRVSNCFQRIKQRLNNYFSPSQASLKIKKPSAHGQKLMI
jgi:hypothetical protein